MRISRTFNNNSVEVVLPDGRSAVLVGPGVGWEKRRGDEVDPAQIEKTFVLDASTAGEGMRSLLVSLPYPVVELTARISERLAEQHNIQMTPAVEIGLADHLAAALDRLASDTSLYNNLLFETKATYRQEFQIALHVLDWVEELSGKRLPLDEAGFITLHLVNAGLTGNMMETQRTAAAVHGVIEIVREWMPSVAAIDPGHFERFLTHLKFVVRRISEGAQLVGGHADVFTMLRRTEPDSYDCARRVADFLYRSYGSELSQEEVLYLMIHLARLRHAGEEAGLTG